jgi:hypothetical protein
MINDAIKITGDVNIVLRGPDGKVKDTRDIKNLVVTAGKGFIAASMLKTTSNTPAAMSHMELGTGTTAAAIGNTALETPISASRVALDSATNNAAVTTYVANFPAGTGTGAVTEAGIFNAASAGTMLCRSVFSVVNKGADDTMSITWAITVS